MIIMSKDWKWWLFHATNLENRSQKVHQVVCEFAASKGAQWETFDKVEVNGKNSHPTVSMDEVSA
eukprot:GABW01002101.1.p3 GENE.GABW01002101.1~~GABW01002101.1.p3  ORF type:complete len:65 (-),score=11.81 GABW01002101.1:214-408(-)